MKNVKWILAGALVGFGGAAFAQSSEFEQDAEQAASETQEAGEDVRTGMERDAEQADERIDRNVDQAAQDASGRAEAVGSGVAESIDEASTAIQGQPSPVPMGSLDDGEVANTLTTNPLGFFTGTGLNMTYSRPLTDKVSAVGGASFARAATGQGSVTRIGLQAGADYFIVGARNEGLRIGPRVETAFGGETAGENSAFGSLAAAGELGYNWISSKGLTAGLGAGVRAGVGSTTDGLGEEGVDNVDGRFSPYGRLNLGYSW